MYDIYIERERFEIPKKTEGIIVYEGRYKPTL